MIRRAETPAELELCAQINNAVHPDRAVTVDQLADATGTFLVHGREGYAYVDRSSIPDSAFTTLRVLKESRRRGVGGALLVAARERASGLGFTGMWGRVGNEAMRAVNERLGYRPLPGWIVVRGPAR